MKWKVAILHYLQPANKVQEVEPSVQVLVEIVEEDLSSQVVEIREVSGELIEVAASLYEMIDYLDVDLIFTVGGVGIELEDIVPEASLKVIERQLPGITEAMRMAALDHDPLAMLNRSVAGIKGRTLIINLPDNPSGILNYMRTVIPCIDPALRVLKSLEY